MVVPALAVALGVNNNGVTLPETVGNITQRLPLLNGPFLQQSTNIFAGIFFPLAVLFLLYQIVWIMLRYMNLECMNKYNGVLSKIVSHNTSYP